MKKLGLFLFILLLLVEAGSAQRKKVGLVLSGGGAKGVAHIGVLKVLEEAGIPIDYITGTSMGAIIGGLYAVGYDAKTLDSLVRVQDWTVLLSDKVSRNNLPFYKKKSTEKYLFSLAFSRESGFNVPAGFVAGNNIYNLFSDLTVGYHDSISFKDLPIPFACVAANMVDGAEVVMDSGVLPLAMRASMAIPGAFAPVTLDSMLLVDGGISNNFPVDVAKNMGAEITIGVDLSTGLKDMEGLDNLVGIVNQLVAFMGMQNYQKNKESVDLYLNPGLQGYSAASFTPEAIDTMILRGERVARANWDKIMELKKKLGLAEDEKPVSHPKLAVMESDTLQIGEAEVQGMRERDEKWLQRRLKIHENTALAKADLHQSLESLYGTGAFTSVNYALTGQEPYRLTLDVKEKPGSSLSFGFRFDSEEMASILLNLTFSHRSLRGSSVSLTGRLNKNPYVQLDYSFGSAFLHRVGVSYMYRYNDMNLYQKGKRVDNLVFNYHKGEINISDIYVRNFNFQVGLRYEYYDLKSDFYTSDYIVDNRSSEGIVSYFASANFESFDKRYYPDRGMSFRAEYALHTDNFVTYENEAPFSSLMFDFQPVIRLTNRIFLLPALYGRVLIGNNVATPYLNAMGGEVFGRYISQQLPFYGIHNIELFDNSLVAVRLSARQRLWARHYLTLSANYALQSNNFFDILKGEGMLGGALTYAYNSIIGPISLTFDGSNWTRNGIGVYFNLGFYF